MGQSATWFWPDAVIAGLSAGSVDVLAAALINHAAPGLVLQAIASGLLGKAAFAGGVHTKIIGLLLQWAMSIVIAAVFLFAASRIVTLTQRPLAAGLAYGVGVYLVMNFVVVPLSRAPHKATLELGHVVADLAAMMLFGVIVAMSPALLGRLSTPWRHI